MHSVSGDEESYDGENTVLCRQAVLRKFLISTKLKALSQIPCNQVLGICNLNIAIINK